MRWTCSWVGVRVGGFGAGGRVGGSEAGARVVQASRRVGSRRMMVEWGVS
jgi:hypothetical protein